ncbi:hypothetical protein [Actinoallomurus sp. CA-150999]|uniref:hypothetical protein n=1 Tax=Actinoallomurus sp. CA-150999 TaxID=3239887 RepID=UPI003D89D2EC
MSRNRIPELEVIEFKGAQSIAEYSRKARALGRDLAAEFEAASEEIKAVLAAQSGHPLLFGIDVKMRARKVARRLRRAAELGQGIATEAVRFNSEFRIQFAEVINPRPRRNKKFDFNDE